MNHRVAYTCISWFPVCCLALVILLEVALAGLGPSAGSTAFWVLVRQFGSLSGGLAALLSGAGLSETAALPLLLALGISACPTLGGRSLLVQAVATHLILIGLVLLFLQCRGPGAVQGAGIAFGDVVYAARQGTWAHAFLIVSLPLMAVSCLASHAAILSSKPAGSRRAAASIGLAAQPA
ncbi:hypothetical protein [Prosthecomicrobium sp. N25]|uniref:hypothetical protein n=1 Tax=Prosthecomicrobium sp. N25 TaxID=3129254 RepID=UPI0030776865